MTQAYLHAELHVETVKLTTYRADEPCTAEMTFKGTLSGVDLTYAHDPVKSQLGAHFRAGTACNLTIHFEDEPSRLEIETNKALRARGDGDMIGHAFFIGFKDGKNPSCMLSVRLPSNGFFSIAALKRRKMRVVTALSLSIHPLPPDGWQEDWYELPINHFSMEELDASVPKMPFWRELLVAAWAGALVSALAVSRNADFGWGMGLVASALVGVPCIIVYERLRRIEAYLSNPR